jgi:hypothetical protein
MRAYFVVFDEYENTGIAFVANTSREAKKMAWRSGEFEGDYIDIRPRWIRNANIDGLPTGEVAANIDSVQRRVYAWIDDACPICGRVTMLELSGNHSEVMCLDCQEKTYQCFGGEGIIKEITQEAQE